jgi:hypothetical protein
MRRQTSSITALMPCANRRRGGTAGVRRMSVRRTRDRVRVDVSAPRGSFNFGAWSFPPIHAAVAFATRPTHAARSCSMTVPTRSPEAAASCVDDAGALMVERTARG